MITAKFRCNYIKKAAYPGSSLSLEEINLGAVYGPKNEPWSTATPSGHLTMSITNPGAMGRIVPGENYLITIQPFPEEETT